MRIYLFILILISSFAIYFIPDDQHTVRGQDKNIYENSIDDHIIIDGRTYKISPDFEIPAGIDKDSPVKLNFSDETHELLSIERLIEDESNSNEMEYHFGIVNAITRANTDLEYRVYVDGVGYLFTRQTRIDERIAFLVKYASVALITKNGEAVICRVLSSNTAVPGKDISIRFSPVFSSNFQKDTSCCTIIKEIR